MASLTLISWAQTQWKADGRLAGRTPLPLTEEGRQQAHGWAEELSSVQPRIVYSSEEQTSRELAAIIAERTGASVKTIAALAEVDAGLWDGLTEEELKRRYPKIHKKWQSDPSSVCPPEGEGMEDAYERLRAPLEKLIRKHDAHTVAVVLGPLAFALARCWLESADITCVRALMSDQPLCYDFTRGDDPITPVRLGAAAAGADVQAAELGT